METGNNGSTSLTGYVTVSYYHSMDGSMVTACVKAYRTNQYKNNDNVLRICEYLGYLLL